MLNILLEDVLLQHVSLLRILGWFSKKDIPGPGSYIDTAGTTQHSFQQCSRFKSTQVLKFSSIRSNRFYSSMNKSREIPGPGQYSINPLSHIDSKYRLSPNQSFGKGIRPPIIGMGTNTSIALVICRISWTGII